MDQRTISSRPVILFIYRCLPTIILLSIQDPPTASLWPAHHRLGLQTPQLHPSGPRITDWASRPPNCILVARSSQIGSPGPPTASWWPAHHKMKSANPPTASLWPAHHRLGLLTPQPHIGFLRHKLGLHRGGLRITDLSPQTPQLNPGGLRITD